MHTGLYGKWRHRFVQRRFCLARGLCRSEQPLLRFEPDFKIPIRGLAILDPEVAGALHDVVVEWHGALVDIGFGGNR